MFSRSGANAFRAVRTWIALALVGLAYRISPVDVLPARGTTAGLPGGTATVFRVKRKIAGNRWSLYEGTDGAAARRTFEGVVQRGELGQMELTMTDSSGVEVVRGRYT